MKDSKINEIIKKYKIDLEKLKEEQLKLAKELDIKDKIDFSLAENFGAFNNTFIGNKLLSCIIVCNKDFEIIDRAYSFDKVHFPYLPEFRSYRELSIMISAFEKLKEKPDVVFVHGQGIIHPRLGLASHFSLSTGVPTIGISNVIIECEIKNQDILKEGEKVGKSLIGKKGSNPIYISPGNQISIDTSYNLTKDLIVIPHKRPEPLHLASKYAKKVRKELE